MSARIPAWPEALSALLAQSARMPFAWGLHDCCQLARKNVTALRGVDPAAQWQLPAYSTAEEAAAVLEQLGGLEGLPGRANLAEIAPVYAQRGDVTLAEFEGRKTLGICCGLKSAFTGKDGLVYTPTLKCLRAWKV